MSNIVRLTPHRTAGPSEHRDQDAEVVAITDRRKVYNVDEVADMLGLSLGGTYQLCRNGGIPPAKKLGNRWVVPKRAFHAWLDDLPEATDDDIHTDRRQWDSGRHPEDRR